MRSGWIICSRCVERVIDNRACCMAAASVTGSPNPSPDGPPWKWWRARRGFTRSLADCCHRGPRNGGAEARRRGGADFDASRRREAQLCASPRLRQPWGKLTTHEPLRTALSVAGMDPPAGSFEPADRFEFSTWNVHQNS